jgi:hypothetical protein
MRPLQTSLRIVALLSVALLARAEGPPPEPRAALVVGHGAYFYAPLTNPVNDAEAVAKALHDAGFDVMLETDADQAKMEQAIHAFFRPTGAPAPAESPSAAAPEPQTALLRPVPAPNAVPALVFDLAGVYRVSGTNPNGSKYRGMVALAQTGDEFRLTAAGRSTENGRTGPRRKRLRMS